METLRIHLFGSLEIHRGDDPLPAFPTQKSKLLFAYLVLHRERRIHRELLCAELWADQPEPVARKGLRNALWRIRSVLEPTEAQRGAYLDVDAHEIGFRSSAEVWVDAWEFERAAEAMEGGDTSCLGSPRAERLAEAAACYRGDLLEGHYESWCLDQQDRLRLKYLAVLERLVAHKHESAEWKEAILLGQRLLRRDPLREHVHRVLMECHLALGDRPSALRQYAACVNALREELEVGPMGETRALFESIRGGERPSTSDANGAVSAGVIRPTSPRATSGLAAELDAALRAIRQITEQLERARLALLNEHQDGSTRLPAADSRRSQTPSNERLRTPSSLASAPETPA
ncbi:MAG: BTAD domain-containing putative transcriptional regulator [Planctomycetota bacterium]